MTTNFGYGITGRIERDDDPMDPREWDNVGTMFCVHSGYDLGDKDAERPSDLDGYLYLPLYLYDHSGITMSYKPFSCQWDSGQVGIIYAKKGFEGMSDEKILTGLEAEVENYNDFITGNCFGYILEDSSGEQLDSCWGFLGDEEYCETCMKEAAAVHIAEVKTQLALDTIEEVGDETLYG